MLPETTQKLLMEMLIKAEEEYEAALEKRKMEKATRKKMQWPWPGVKTDMYKVLSIVQALGPCKIDEIRETLNTIGRRVKSKKVSVVLVNLKKAGWIGSTLPGAKKYGAIWFDLDRPSVNS